jgi:hypothetical protein
MSLLFAHHVEPIHYPILLAMAVAGFLSGWQLTARVLEWRRRPR